VYWQSRRKISPTLSLAIQYWRAARRRFVPVPVPANTLWPLCPGLVEQLLEQRAERHAPLIGERGESGEDVGAHFQVELRVATGPPATGRP
jgi:hypothetical protein